VSEKVVNIGIVSREGYKNRTLAIARGEYKPAKDEPKIWFESLQAMEQVLGNENRELLKKIWNTAPVR
jgi:predicted transcriptional regulator